MELRGHAKLDQFPEVDTALIRVFNHPRALVQLCSSSFIPGPAPGKFLSDQLIFADWITKSDSIVGILSGILHRALRYSQCAESRHHTNLIQDFTCVLEPLTQLLTQEILLRDKDIVENQFSGD